MGLAWLSKSVPVRASDLMGSSLPLWPSSLAFEVFARAGARKSGVLDRTTLPVPFAPLQSVITRSRRAEISLGQASSPAVCPPSASSWRRAATHPGDTTPGFWYLLSVSHALEVFIRPSSAGLVSCRSRPWGFPSGPISTRRAVRSLERPCLLAVGPETSASRPCSLRASLTPARIAARWVSDPHGLSLARGLSPLAGTGRTGLPLLSFSLDERTRPARPSRVLPATGLAELLRACHPFRAFPPRRCPRSSRGFLPWIAPREVLPVARLRSSLCGKDCLVA
jgi:hypothetical protein